MRLAFSCEVDYPSGMDKLDRAIARAADAVPPVTPESIAHAKAHRDLERAQVTNKLLPFAYVDDDGHICSMFAPVALQHGLTTEE